MSSLFSQEFRQGRHLDLPGLLRGLPRGDVLHLAHGQAVVARLGVPALGLPPEVLLHPHLHRAHQRSGHLHRRLVNVLSAFFVER